MNYAPDLGSVIWILMLWVSSAGLLYLIWRLDEEFRSCKKKRVSMVWAASCIVISASGYGVLNGRPVIEKVSFFLLFLYFIVCSVQDILMCMISDFLQYIGLLGGCILLSVHSTDPEIGFSLILFGILQGVLFLRMYGQADGMAFLICSLYLAGEGMDMERYLEHMAAAVILLGAVQLCRKNISRKGNLKNPVAMLPYIATSFFLVI